MRLDAKIKFTDSKLGLFSETFRLYSETFLRDFSQRQFSFFSETFLRDFSLFSQLFSENDFPEKFLWEKLSEKKFFNKHFFSESPSLRKIEISLKTCIFSGKRRLEHFSQRNSLWEPFLRERISLSLWEIRLREKLSFFAFKPCSFSESISLRNLLWDF